MPDVTLVVLFGSVVRGSARKDSDADIGVSGGGFWQQLELGSALAGALGREPHVVDLTPAPELLAYEVARHGVPLYEREPFAWATFQARAAARYFDFRPAHELWVSAARERLAARAARENERG